MKTADANARPYRGRFAPSPSGWLHLGNARTALFAWTRARGAGGRFIMRVEDLDQPRSRPEAVMGNLAELRWLGLDWDEGPDVGGDHGPYLQSRRTNSYLSALDRLKGAGHVSESYLSRREVAAVSGAGSGAGSAAGEGDAGADELGPVYGPAHRDRNLEVAGKRRAAGRLPSLRFTTPSVTLEFDDAIVGRRVVDAEHEVGDFVLRRADGRIAYQLAVVVDDAAMGVSEVARGADLLTSTAAQLLLYRALGERPPSFAHVGLLLGPAGGKLSKRHGAMSLHELRAAGVRPQRVLGLLARTLGFTGVLDEVDALDLLALAREADDSHGHDEAGGSPSPITIAQPYRLSEAELRWLGP